MYVAPQVSACETVLVDLTHWLTRVMQYSAHHPACERLGEKVLASIGRALRETSPVSFGVLKEGITLGGGASLSHPSVGHRLARHLHERGVLAVRFLDGIQLSQLTRFMDVLLLPVQTIFDRGG